MEKLRWKKDEKNIISTNGLYKIIERPLVYAVEYKCECIGYGNSQKEAADIAQKHFDKQRGKQR